MSATSSDPTYRLVRLRILQDVSAFSNAFHVGPKDIIKAVHAHIESKLETGEDSIEALIRDSDGYLLLTRRRKHADQLIRKEIIDIRDCFGSAKLTVDAVMPDSTKVIITNLPIFAVKDDVETALKKLGIVRFVRAGVIENDIRDGTFKAWVIFANGVPDKITVFFNGKPYVGDVSKC